MEIAALHTAGERAVVRTSRIRKELGTSEKELTALEREMTEIGETRFNIAAGRGGEVGDDRVGCTISIRYFERTASLPLCFSFACFRRPFRMIGFMGAYSLKPGGA